MARKMVVELVASGVILALSSAMFVSAAQKAEVPLLSLLYAGGCVITFLLSIICLDMAALKPADSHTLRSLFAQYKLYRASVVIFGWWAKRHMDAILKDCEGTQEKTLRWIIQENKDTVYGRDHNLSEIQTRQDLVRLHPLTTYAAFREYADRVARGEKNVMTKADILMMGMSSGTTGQCKKYPFARTYLKRLLMAFWASTQKNPEFVTESALQRVFSFRVFHPLVTNEHGIKEGGIGNIVAKPLEFTVVPDCFMKTSLEGPSFYIQAVFALRDREVARLDGYSTDSWYAFFKFIIANKDQICDCISQGELSAFPQLTEEIRWEANQSLKADPARAEELREILKGPTQNLPQRIWPGLVCMFGASGGGFAHSAKLLREHFIGELPMYFGLHVATEGTIGISYDPPLSSQVYTCLTEIVVLEFIPEENIEEENPETLFPDLVEVGKRYELVLTNINGLYRNRFGDVVEIVGFSGNTPKYRFLYRAGQILNIAYDRTPEKMVQDAVVKTSRCWSELEVVSYTATESMHLEKFSGDLGSPAMYVIFMEVVKDDTAVNVAPEFETIMDDTLCSLHSTYKEFRETGSIGKLRIVSVLPGTFNALRNLLTNDRPGFQFKMPRVMRKENALEFLWQQRIKR